MLKIGEGAQFAEPREIVAMRVKPDARRANAARDEPALGRANHAHGNVRVAAREILVAVGDRKLHRDARIASAKAGENRRQRLRAHDLACGDANDAAIDRRRRRGGARQRRRGRGHRFGMRDKRFRGCRRRAAWRAHEQRRPERLLQRIDMAPDRRLGEAQLARGSAEAQVARDFEEGAQFVPIGFAPAHTKMYIQSREICNSADVRAGVLRRRQAVAPSPPPKEAS